MKQPDADIAFDELLKEKLLENVDSKFFTINLDERETISQFLGPEPEERLDISQPLKDTLDEYIFRFAVHSKWEYSNQHMYHYYTKKDHRSFWIVITKKKSAGSETR